MKPLTDQERTALLTHLMALQDRDPDKRYAALDALREAIELADDRKLKERTYAKGRRDATAWIDVMGSGYAGYDSDGDHIPDAVGKTKSEVSDKLLDLMRPGGVYEHIKAVAVVSEPVPRDRLRPAAQPATVPRVRRMRAGNG